jgi:hypothetical protein
MTKWLVRPAKHDDESHSGYQFRLAEANGYRSRQRWECANSFGGRKSTKESASTSIDNRYTLSAYQRVCPACMFETPYLREVWDHALLPTCLRHKVTLETHCPNCHEIIHRRPGNIKACICGHAYSDILSKESEPNALEYVLSDKLGYPQWEACNTALPHLDHLSVAQLLKLILLIGTHENFEDLKKPRKISLKKGSENATKVMSQANEALIDWPTNFHDLLNRTYSAHTNNSTLRSVFGYFYVALYKDLRGDSFEFIRSAFEVWLRQEWKGQLTERHRRLQSTTRSSKKVRSITAISKETGVSHKLLAELVAKGEIRGSTRDLPSGRKSTMIEFNQDAQISKLTSRFDLLSASQRMGIPEKRLKMLLEGNIISGIAPPKGGRWQIHLSELERIQGLVLKIKIVSAICRDKYWTFNEVLRYKLAESESFPDFFNSVFRGEVQCRRQPSTQKKGVSAVLIDKVSLAQWQQEQCPGIPVQALAQRLSIKQEVVYHLVNTNLIPTINRGRLGSFVDVALIAAFESKYLWARDIAKAARTSPRKVISLLRDCGVEAVTGPDTDGCRQYLYVRKEVVDSSLFSVQLQ